MGGKPAEAAVRRWYGSEPFAGKWLRVAGAPVADAGRLADVLERQNVEFGASAAALENIEKLRAGARAVVTGQQVVLSGGPLLTFFNAPSALATANDAPPPTGSD